MQPLKEISFYFPPWNPTTSLRAHLSWLRPLCYLLTRAAFHAYSGPSSGTSCCAVVQLWAHRLRTQSPTRLPFLQMPATLQEPLGHPHFWLLATNLGVPIALSDSTVCWNHSQKSGKCYSYDYSFITKDISQDQPNQETHRMRSRWVLGTGLPCTLLEELGYITLPDFLLEFHFTGMVNWIIGYLTEFSPQANSIPQRLGSFWQAAPNLSHTISINSDVILGAHE